MLRVAALALTIFVFSDGDGNAQSRATQGSASSEGPFGQLAGSWSGSGTIDLSNGRHEPIKCRASYDVLEEQNKLQLNIHCASDSYNFDARQRDLRRRDDHRHLERVDPQRRGHHVRQG
jgi:hypothetical protein